MHAFFRMTFLAAGLAVAVAPALFAGDESGAGASSTPAYENPSAPPARGERHGDKPGRPHMGGRQRMASRIFAELGLSDEQKGKIRSIREKYQPEVRALREDATLAPEAKREKARAIRQAMQQETRAVLTPEQAAKFDAMIKNAHAARRGEHRQRHDQPERPTDPAGEPSSSPPR